MDPSSLILIAVAGVAIMATVGAFTVAFRRSVGPHRRDQREDMQTARTVTARSAPAATPPTETESTTQQPDQTETAAGTGAESRRVTVVEIQRVVEVSPEEAGVTRRQFFNRAATAVFGSYLAMTGTSMLAFLWPKLTGGFGAPVDAGPVSDITAQLVQPDGSVTPFVVTEARAYVVPINDAQLDGSQFDQPELVADGLMAMWWRCVHLGCRAPWCAPSAGFECPCHGSKYNLFGEYQAGPAPRNLDRFAVEVTSDGRLIIDTGNIVQTPRAPSNTVPYPQGPTCITI